MCAVALGSLRGGPSRDLHLSRLPPPVHDHIDRCFCCTALWSLMAQSVISRRRSNRSLWGAKRTSAQGARNDVLDPFSSFEQIEQVLCRRQLEAVRRRLRRAERLKFGTRVG